MKKMRRIQTLMLVLLVSVTSAFATPIIVKTMSLGDGITTTGYVKLVIKLTDDYIGPDLGIILHEGETATSWNDGVAILMIDNTNGVAPQLRGYDGSISNWVKEGTVKYVEKNKELVLWFAVDVANDKHGLSAQLNGETEVSSVYSDYLSRESVKGTNTAASVKYCTVFVNDKDGQTADAVEIVQDAQVVDAVQPHLFLSDGPQSILLDFEDATTANNWVLESTTDNVDIAVADMATARSGEKTIQLSGCNRNTGFHIMDTVNYIVVKPGDYIHTLVYFGSAEAGAKAAPTYKSAISSPTPGSWKTTTVVGDMTTQVFDGTDRLNTSTENLKVYPRFRMKPTSLTNTLYYDDFLLYTDANAKLDLTAPKAAKGVMMDATTIKWMEGADMETKLTSTVVLRSMNMSADAPMMMSQVAYTVGDSIGDWEVIAMVDAGTEMYNDATATSGTKYAYAVAHKDMAYNYSTPTNVAIYGDTTTVEICENGSYAFKGEDLDKAGFYYDSLTSVDGYDSLLVLELIVNPSYMTADTTEYMVADTTFKSMGTQMYAVQMDSLSSCKACDSIIAQYMKYTYAPNYYSDTLTTEILDTIYVNDTTLTTVFDTSYVSVNDTLVFELVAGIDDANVESVLVKVFPNPSTTTINVSFADISVLSNVSLKLYSMTGQMMAEKDVTQATCSLDISGFSAGTYLLNIVKDAVVLDNKVIIIK